MSRIHSGALQLVAILCFLVPQAVGSPIVLETRELNGDERNFRILDPKTGSVWIGPPFTNGLSAREVEQLFPGYRLPSRDEAVEMLANAGLPLLPSGVGMVPVEPAAAGTFRDLMSDSVNVVGTYMDEDAVGRIGMYTASDWDINLRSEPATLGLDKAVTFEGHWLVQPVPEPSTAWSLVLGLAAVMFRVRAAGFEPATSGSGGQRSIR